MLDGWVVLSPWHQAVPSHASCCIRSRLILPTDVVMAPLPLQRLQRSSSGGPPQPVLIGLVQQTNLHTTASREAASADSSARIQPPRTWLYIRSGLIWPTKVVMALSDAADCAEASEKFWQQSSMACAAPSSSSAYSTLSMKGTSCTQTKTSENCFTKSTTNYSCRGVYGTCAADKWQSRPPQTLKRSGLAMQL